MKQVEKRSGVWKKKYIYFKTRPIHMTMHVCHHEVEVFVDIKKLVD